MHIRTYMHTYIHTYIHTYMHTYIHTYIHTYVHTYIHTVYDKTFEVENNSPLNHESFPMNYGLVIQQYKTTSMLCATKVFP